ncbi:MAG: GGDEF domain-containing protein, partial [Clostridia bacterium]|nr:GGDEF domain-containing protein [Clostridia bacterium]
MKLYTMAETEPSGYRDRQRGMRMKRHIAAEWLPSVILMSLPGILYFVASFTPARELANTSSSLNALCVGMVISMVYWCNRNRIPWLFLMAAFACLFWGFADMVWGWLEARGIDPGGNSALILLYAAPNVLLAAGLIKTVFTQVTKWSAAQMITDQLTVLLLSGLFLWSVLFEENWADVQLFLSMDFTSMVSVLLDFVIAVSVAQWLLSESSSSVSRHATLLMVGCSFYAFTDLWYYFALLHGTYLSNGLIDFSYAFSLNLLGIGTILWDLQTRGVLKRDPKSAPSKIGRWVMLAFLPMMTVLLQVTGSIPTPFNLMILLTDGVILFQNWWASRYIRLSRQNARLLQRATLQNQLLENMVIQQRQKLTDVSSKDSMTGLYRRQPFLDLMDVLLYQESCQYNGCLMVVDIDRLKAINNVYGHEAGDYVIIETARRLQTWNMWNASLSRIGGEEFGVFLCGRFANEQMLHFGREIRHRLSRPITYHDATLMIT